MTDDEAPGGSGWDEAALIALVEYHEKAVQAWTGTERRAWFPGKHHAEKAATLRSAIAAFDALRTRCLQAERVYQILQAEHRVRADMVAELMLEITRRPSDTIVLPLEYDDQAEDALRAQPARLGEV